MNNAVQQGKPHTGNPHVRFDEGVDVPTRSGRSALLYMHHVKIRLMVAVAFAMIAFVGGASEVSPEKASIAVCNWMKRHSLHPMRTSFKSGKPKTSRAFKNESGRTLFHVVEMTDGGFVVTSGDTKIAPIIAFSDVGSLDAIDNNPLYGILVGDMENRVTALDAASPLLKSNGSGVAQPLNSAARLTKNEREWLTLTEDDASSDSAEARPARLKATATSLDDERVAPLVQSKWNQSGKWNGEYIYNYYTTNHYVCGCVATAVAQVMRYWKHPIEPVAKNKVLCEVDGVETEMEMVGGAYAWNKMPLTASEITDVSQCEAIGRLTYDVGVASKMNWGKSESGAFLGDAVVGLNQYFGYQANSYSKRETGNLSIMEYAASYLLASLNAGMPAVISIHKYGETGHDNDSGHAVVLDGYGYIGDEMYCHINWGWGYGGGWYNLFSEEIVAGGHTYRYLWGAIYNIHPADGGGAYVLSGRVTDSSGNPVPGAIVKIVFPSGELENVTSDDNGIWHVRHGRYGDFSISAAKGEMASAEYLKVTVSGNVWNADLVLSTGEGKPDLLFVKPSDWSAPLFLTGDVDGTSGQMEFKEGQSIFLCCRFANAGTPIAGGYRMHHRTINAKGETVKSAYTSSSDMSYVFEDDTGGMMSHVSGVVPSNLPAGRYTYSCKLDCDEAVDEMDESNNEASVEFTVGTVWSYAVSGEEATITGVVHIAESDLTVPSQIDGYQVVSIGENALKGKPITSIVIPESVKTIGEEAFRSCSSLTNVVLAEGLESIGNWAFYRCTALRTVVIPESVTKLGSFCFSYCTGLETAYLPISWKGKSLTFVFSNCGDQLNIEYYSDVKTYTIIFNRMDFSGVIATRTFDVGVSCQLPTISEDLGWSYAGHVFLGWTTNNYSTAQGQIGIVHYVDGANVKDIALPGDTITLYAVWAANTYTVRYRKYDGSGDWATEDFECGKTYTLAWLGSELGWSRPGYEFCGWVPWNPDAKPRLCKYDNGQPVKDLAAAGATINLYCGWKSSSSYRVCFHRCAGPDDLTKMNQVILRNKEDSLAWMDSMIGWKRDGYTFAGWDESEKATAVKYANGAKVKNLAMDGGTKHLYAVWRAKDDHKYPYTVKFYRYDGSGETRTQSFNAGTVQSLLWFESQLGWKRDGYEFCGWVPWNPDTKARLCKYTNGQKVVDLASKSGETVNLYAAWKSSSSYRVCFHMNDGTDVKMNQVILRNKEDNLAWMDSQIGWKREGYVFKGWAETEKGAVKYANGAKVKNLAMDGGTKHLYAVWRVAD